MVLRIGWQHGPWVEPKTQDPLVVDLNPFWGENYSEFNIPPHCTSNFKKKGSSQQVY